MCTPLCFFYIYCTSSCQIGTDVPFTAKDPGAQKDWACQYSLMILGLRLLFVRVTLGTCFGDTFIWSGEMSGCMGCNKEPKCSW